MSNMSKIKLFTTVKRLGAFKRFCCNTKQILTNPKCKVALITGGAQGIGLAIAHEFLAEKGRHVGLIGLDTCSGREAVNELNCAYGENKAMFINKDVQNQAQIAEAFALIEKEFGKIDVVVNSAGICDGANWEREMLTDFGGVVRTTYLAANIMGKGGVILNISGTYGFEPLPPGPTLSANMHATVGFSRSFGAKSNFVRTGVRIVCLCPGVTKTNFIEGLEHKGHDAAMGKELSREFCELAKRQTTEVCGKAALHLLKFAESGSIWVVDGSKLLRLNIPNWKTYATLVSQYF